jgi:hypothetical protein
MALFDFAVVGAQKSGTTLYGRCLNEHHEVFLPYADIDYIEREDYDSSNLAPISNFLRSASPNDLKGIKRPDYLGHYHCAERIHQISPNCKIIVVLRNPVQRAVSAYFHFMRDGLIPARDIEIGMPKLMANERYKKYPRAEQIIDFGFYYKHLQPYRELFGDDNILVLLNSELRSDRDVTLRRSFEFLGVSPHFQVPKHLDSANIGVYSMPRIKLHHALSPIFFQYDSERRRVVLRHPIMGIARKGFTVFDRHILGRIFGNKNKGISDELKADLGNLYRQDIENLENYLNRDLPWLS